MQLDEIEIPDDLAWVDEWRWTPYAEQAWHALDGTLIVERSTAAVAGRPVTLEGAAERAWVSRATLDALHAALDRTELTLTLWDARELTVGWRHGDTPIEAQEHIGSGWHHSLILRLREV